jgi:hypothetical protein
MIVTNKRLLISESHGDSNRCTHCKGKSNQNTTYASHSSPRTSGVHFLWAVPVRDNLLLAPTKSKYAPTPGGSFDNQRQTDPAVVGERCFDLMVTQLHQLTGPISPVCDRYVQYLLTGANRMVLNRHRWGLQPWRCRLATYPLPDLPK